MIVEYQLKQHSKITLVTTEYRTSVLEDVVAFLDRVLAPFHYERRFTRSMGEVLQQRDEEEEEEEDNGTARMCRLLEDNLTGMSQLTGNLSQLTRSMSSLSLTTNEDGL